MSDRRWLRARAQDGAAVHMFIHMPGYQPGDEVVVMPAADADLLMAMASRHQHSERCVCDECALLARLSPGPGPAEKCRSCNGTGSLYSEMFGIVPCPNCDSANPLPGPGDKEGR